VKLNFWQWLAVLLLALGIAWMVYDHFYKTATPASPSAPTTRQSN
jgi:hypothetical protein